jgi:hypothetical protein
MRVRKFFVIGLVAAVAAIALSVAPVASAGRCSGLTCTPTNTVKIEHYADIFGFVAGVNGAMVIVDVNCTGGTGSLLVHVTQSASQSSFGFAASGDATVPVACDGTDRRIPVSVIGFPDPGFGLGCADATAILSLPAMNVIAATGTTIEIVD